MTSKPSKASKATKPGQSNRRKERANVERRLLGVHLRCEELSARDLRILNISELGMGIEVAPVADRLSEFSPSKVFSARIMVGHAAAPVDFTVVHASAVMLGLEFVAPTDFLRSIIRRVFDSELLGASLCLVSSEGEMRVFETGDGSRLEMMIKVGALDRFSIEVLGNSVKWDGERGLRLVQNSRSMRLPDFLRNQLIKLVQSAEAIGPEHRKRLELILMGVT
jgi:hypothetical protein